MKTSLFYSFEQLLVYEFMVLPFLSFKVKVKGLVHFEINFWYLLAYLKGIQDVGVFISTVVSILIFSGQTVVVCQSYNGGLWSPPQRACREKSKLNMI